MNRFIAPGAALALVTASLLSPLLLAPPELPASPSGTSERARITVLCPSAGRTAVAGTVAAASVQGGLTTASLGKPETSQSLPDSGVLTNQQDPVRVSGARSATFGAVVGVAAEAGPERGLSLATCDQARSEAWLPGVSTSEDNQAELVLTNLDNTEAAVDITVLGVAGRLATPGSRGIVVPANSRRIVALSPIASAPEPVTLRVTTSAGRVVVGLRQRLWRDKQPIGTDWVLPAAEPATSQVIPAIPAGSGRRDLVLVNPGERTAQVVIQVLGEGGTTQIPGSETVDVPAGTTRVVALERGLVEAAGGLRLASQQPFTASLISGTGGGNASSDFATVPAAGPIGQVSLWPVPVTAAATVKLELTNAGDTEAAASVSWGSTTVQVTLAPGASSMVNVSKVEVPQLRIVTEATELYAGVVATQKLGSVNGLAVFALRASQAQQGFPRVHNDPHTGS